MKQFKSGVIYIASIACLLMASTMAVSAQAEISLNVVYDCPPFNDAGGVSSGRKFKVLNCDGRGTCKVFMINEYNPNGGFEIDKARSEVLYDIKRYRCVAPGGGQAAPANGPTATPKEQPTPKGAACPASDAGSDGTGMAGGIRRSIREGAEFEPQPGLDGRITLTYQSFVLTGSRRWLAYTDPLNARGKTMYTARATYTACTDYNTRLEFIKRTREFACHKEAAGEYSCSIIAAPSTNVKDKTWSVEK